MKTLTLYFGLVGSAIFAQTLTGTVVADDTGTPLQGTSVIAIQITTPGERSATVSSPVDAKGQFAIDVPPGEYLLCARNAGHYLDPCQWGGAKTVVAGAPGIGTAGEITLRLERGAPFLVRLHDSNGLFAKAGSMPAAALSATVQAPGRKPFILPLVYDGGSVRDWGGVVPLEVAMTVTVGSNRLRFTESGGAPLREGGIPFQIRASDLARKPVAAPAGFRVQSDVTMVHLYASDLR